MPVGLIKLDVLIDIADEWGKLYDVLEEITVALSDEQANDIAEHIARMWDIEDELKDECERMEVEW